MHEEKGIDTELFLLINYDYFFDYDCNNKSLIYKEIILKDNLATDLTRFIEELDEKESLFEHNNKIKDELEEEFKRVGVKKQFNGG